MMDRRETGDAPPAVEDSRGEEAGVFARHGYLSDPGNGNDGADREDSTGEAGDPGVGERPDEPSPDGAPDPSSPAEPPDTTTDTTDTPEPEPEPTPPPLVPENELEVLRERVASGPVVLIVPPEIFVHFYPAGPEQVINALAKAGFDQIHFETLGDELVALAYLKLWRSNEEKRTWIRSTHPLVVEYCRARHPELLPYLAPIVPPAIALARWLRHEGEERPLLYAGLDFPEVNGTRTFDAAVSFVELAEFLAEKGIDPVEEPWLLKTMPPERRRFVSAAGGLPLAMLDEERMSSRYFRKLRGLHYLGAVSRLIQNDGTHLGFVDILPFDGALDHPAMGPSEELYTRRAILDLAEPSPADGPVIHIPPGLDLSIEHRPRKSRLPYDAIEEIERALEDARESTNGGLGRVTADFAGYLSLTESLVRTRPELALGLLDISRGYVRAVRDATHDALTDLYSYRALIQRAREELGQANRSGSRLAMLFVDLDRFKEINDEYGHPAGNAMLRAVARAIELAIRSTDIAGRFGGDEFVAILVDADFEGAVRVAEDVRRRIAELSVPVDGGTVGTTASIGIAFHAGAEDSLLTADDLFAEADAALYIAKAHGGNRVHPAVREGKP